LFIARPSKIYPNWDFWFENKPSGNPGMGSHYYHTVPGFDLSTSLFLQAEKIPLDHFAIADLLSNVGYFTVVVKKYFTVVVKNTLR
jgi:hypothetical protein